MAPRSASEKVHPKEFYFSSACEYVKLPFSLWVPKKKKNMSLTWTFFSQPEVYLFILYFNTLVLNQILLT
jgi:hypothetical protein